MMQIRKIIKKKSRDIKRWKTIGEKVKTYDRGELRKDGTGIICREKGWNFFSVKDK